MPKLKRKSLDQINEEKRTARKRSKKDDPVHIGQQDTTAQRRITRQKQQNVTAEQERNSASRRLARRNPRRRAQEQILNTEARRVKRQNQQTRTKERIAHTAAQRLIRQNQQRRTEEQIANTTARRSVRQEQQRRTKEQIANTTARRSVRQDQQRRTKEQIANTSARRSLRQEPQRRTKEQISNTTARRSLRQDQQRRTKEQIANTSARRSLRQNQQRRTKEQIANTKARGTLRQNLQRRTKEQIANTKARRLVRQNQQRRTKEQKANTSARSDKRKGAESYQQLLSLYNNRIKSSPSIICSCCGGLWYEESTVIVSKESLNSQGLAQKFIDDVLFVNQNTHRLCLTCMKSVKQKSNQRLPKLSLANGFDFTTIPDELKGLSPLEERLVAVRLPFMQIRLLGSERQSILHGNVVNVENDLDICAKALPRKFDETSTVQVQLMRRMEYRHPYMHETIRPYKVYQAAKYLVSTELYKSENVTLSDDWEMCGQDSTLDFICNNSDVQPVQEDQEPIHVDIPETQPATAKYNNESGQQELPTFQENDLSDHEQIYVDSSDKEHLQAPHTSTMGAEETLIFRDDDLSCYGIQIAPAQGNIPVPLHRDLNAEVLSFPTIYAGIGRNFRKGLKVSYTDIAKSELRRFDRRACRPTKLLYSFKKSFNEKVFKAYQVCMRQKRGSEKITAGKIRSPGYLHNMFIQDRGYPVFKTIRSSPMYWQQRSKKVLAMIRQLGKCTFFITLSAAETKWNELLVTLVKIVQNRTIDENEAAKLPFDEIAQLIRSDPVTCMRHFDYKYRALLNLLLKKECGLFAPYILQDHFSRLEFQMRGSPHSHGLYWIQNSPIYDDSSNQAIQECITFIDKFITCERCEDGEMKNLIGYQIHRHSQTCRKNPKRKQKCRFDFPKPPMEETRILIPLSSNVPLIEKKEAEDLYIKIKEKLNQMGRAFKEDLDYDVFLETVLQTTHMDYIFAIRSSIKRPTVFLKRSTNAIFVNAYNRKLLEAWKANIDVQFVLDVYACARYCVSYIMKSEGGVSALLQAASKNARNGNLSIQEKLKQIGNILINGSEISAQEAAAFLLGIPNTHCSRQDVYVNTTLPEDRIRILKSKPELDQLEDDNEEVCAKGNLDHYCQRPTELESLCLAEFATMYQYTKNATKSSMKSHDDTCSLHDGDDESTEEIDDFTEVPLTPKHKTENSSSMSLIDFSGYLKKRRVRKILRFRHYGKAQDPTNYFREQLMLFVPWRDEEKDLLAIDSIQKATLHQIEIQGNSKPFYWNYDVHDGVLNELLHNAIEEEYNTNDENETIVQNYEELEANDAFFQYNDLNDKRSGQTSVGRFLKPRMVEEEGYLDLMRKLNDRQRRFVLNTLFNLKTTTTPFYNFLSGGAGVGKSYALTAIVQSYLRYYAKFPNTNPDKLCVLVSAPTGKAAFNVFGMTLHCTFRLPPSQYGGKVSNLDNSTLNTLRNRLENVQLFIIDEISMVSVKQLFDVDQRLRQVFGTTQSFGGKSVVVFGHLRQLPPVAASHVFTIPHHLPMGACVGNHLWHLFNLYELTEIMRQHGQFHFCKALNNMSEGCMDAEDILLLKSREVNVDNLPPAEAIRLFKTNLECDEYNSEVHQRLQTDGCISIAHDQIQGTGSEIQKQNMLKCAMTLNTMQADGLPYQTRLQVGGEYFVSTNVDVEDGLFNGSTGTLKLIEYQRQKTSGDKIPTRTWLDFHNPLIGMNKRASIQACQKENVHVDWVPVDREKRNLSIKSRQHIGLEIIRKQIPVVAANGMTINKSQGSSLPFVVVAVQRYEKETSDISKRRTKTWLSRELLYVACSRCTSLEGLYILGEFKPPLPPGPEDIVSKEMTRLRAIPFKFSLRFLQDYGDEFEKIYFHNIQSFRAHKQDILADNCAMSSNILAFVEPWLLSSDSIDLPHFNCIHRTNCRTSRNSEGALLFSKVGSENTYNTFINVDYASLGHLVTLHFKVSSINVIMVYKSPHYPQSTFIKKMADALTSITGEILLFGDINIDLQKPEGHKILELLHAKNLISKLPIDCSSTDYGSTIDICFSNVSKIDVWYYESYYSFHKPICIIWPKVTDTF